jgi:hypothetical protein
MSWRYGATQKDNPRMRLKSFVSFASTIALSLTAIAAALPGSSIAAQDTTPTPIPVCPGAPVTQLSVGEYARVAPGLTAYIRKDPTKNGDEVAKVAPVNRMFLTGGPTCAESILWWPVVNEGAGDVGWMAEAGPNAYFILPAYTGSNFFPTSSKNDADVQYKNISFTYAGLLVKPLGNTIYAATISDYPGIPTTPVGADPQHTQIRFGALPTTNPAIFPEILVYHTDAISKVDDSSKKAVEAIKALIKAQSDLTQVQSIDLFRSNIPQALHARNAYLKFKDGSGIRFIAHYAFAVDPIVDGLVYTFVGLTSDNQSYVVVSIPLTTAVLKDNDPGAAMTAANFDAAGYLKQTATKVEAAKAADFAPNLDKLDEMVKTIFLN